MKITNVEPKIVSVPLEVPKFISTRPIKSREYLMVKISTDRGVSGWGLTFSALDGKVAVEKELKPLLLNEDPFMVEELWSRMFRGSVRWGRRGSYIRAISAVDIALWDIIAKACKQPLYRVLGGYRKKVPVYASGGYYSLKGEKDEVEAVDGEMKGHAANGFMAAKMKIGGLDLETDLKRVEKAREALGPGRKLYLDINNGWKMREISGKTLDRLEAIGVDWLEEPFLPDDLEDFKKLRLLTRIPLATGEIHSTRWDFKLLLETQAADIWQTDVVVVGGITEFRRVMALASAWNIPVAPHAMHEIHGQLAASSPEIFILEYFDTTGDIVNYGKLLKNPLKAKAGFVEVPEDPGVGMIWDEDLIAKYEIK
ncbi:MAG: mandelate racemase/muconate lactonizing enzyme family protein [Deltaproteobacteria bacterium]|nr:mandelate racemase/muconate lactonizing enzyme family protein [Deltaproteobacteria bacterium]